jgi:outer membrane lipoprotein-sorting protein
MHGMREGSIPSVHGTAKMSRRFTLSILALLLTVSAESARGGDPLDGVLRRLEKAMGGLSSVDTAFVQEKEMAVFKTKLKITGHVYLVKPDKFAWHVETPMRLRMVMVGDRMAQWDAESGEVQRVNLGKHPAFQAAANQMRGWLDGDYRKLLDEYGVRIAGGDPLTLEFTPLESSGVGEYLQRVSVTFRDDEKYIQSIRIVESNGDSTLLRFTDTVLNGRVPDGAWEVKP